MKRILAALFMLASLLIANIASAVTTHEVLTAILTLPQYGGDIHADTPDQRAKLLRPVARAIATVAKNKTEAAALVAVAYSESALARYVVDGECHQGPAGARCDGGLSRGVFQIRSWCRALWAGPEGAATRHLAGARCAVQRLRQGTRECFGKGYEGVMSYYGTGRCAWRPAKNRAALTALLEGRLKQVSAPAIVEAPVVVEGATRVSVQ